MKVTSVLILGGALTAANSVAFGQAERDSQTASAVQPGSYSSSAKSDASITKSLNAVPEDYRIGIEDSLFISVWKEPDLSSQVTVRPDGIITMPLLNDINVVGLSTVELQNLLTDKLKPFLNEPQVTVIVRQINSRKVYLAGQVGHPGTFELNSKMTVLQLLLEAGGPGPFAKSGSIYVLRNQNGKKTKLPFSYKRVLSGKANDLALIPGDMVVVP